MNSHFLNHVFIELLAESLNKNGIATREINTTKEKVMVLKNFSNQHGFACRFRKVIGNNVFLVEFSKDSSAFV